MTPVRIGRVHGEGLAPTAELWRRLDATPPAPESRQSYLELDRFLPYRLNAHLMRGILVAAPSESPGWTINGTHILALPKPDGTTAHFRVASAEMMEPELAAEFPDIRTYRGQGIEDPAAVLAMDMTPLGFHAQVISSGGNWYIDPYYHLDTSVYASYFRSDMAARALPDPGNDVVYGSGELATGQSGPPLAQRSGTQLRTYRLAVAATGEYTTFFGGAVNQGQAAIVTAINRVSGIMETELSIRLTLVAGNSSLVFTNGMGDPYSNTNANAMLTQNQTTVTNLIGSANYDIGHVFATGGGGLAAFASVGFNSIKAQGCTGTPSPIGDAFYVDYVIHEIGHQFGADHTFNTSADPQREASSAYEPGSGSTIMGYAGITGDDLQSNSDPYFHSRSFDQIIAFVDNTIPSIGGRTATGNLVPTINGGADFAIPTGTPFALTASGSDGNGDTLTYNWEERDLGVAQLLSSPDNGSSPIFRSWTATTNPTRTFPRLSNLLNNTLPIGEKYPAVARAAMRFRVTVRDNRAGGGGVNTDDVQLQVVNTGGAFTVTSPNTNVLWNGNTPQTVTWNVSGTTAAPISAALVNIRISTDGGNTFPTILVSNSANDGAETVTVPNIATTNARIKVEPVGNVFFDLSNVNFRIQPVPPQVAAVTVNGGQSNLTQRSRVTSLTVAFDTVVNFATNPLNVAATFQLARIGGGAVGGMSANVTTVAGATVVTLDGFTGAETQFGSLADGRYQLTVVASQVSAGGLPLNNGTNFVFGDSQGLFRYFGDINADRRIDISDFGPFSTTFNVASPNPSFNGTFDFNNDGRIDIADFGQFSLRYFTTLP